MKFSSTLFSLASICCIACGCAAPAASEDERVLAEGEAQALNGAKLLALGDSIAFGYNPKSVFSQPQSMKGYPETFNPEYSVQNASCPGETSASLYSPTAPDNGCDAYRAAYPLHVDYANTQLDYALGRITDPTDTPTLVTLNIGANDIFLVQASCASTSDPVGCFQGQAFALISSITTNVATILATIRAAGYQGPIVYMNLYALDYNNPGTVAFLTALNASVSNAAITYGSAQIADAYTAFKIYAGTKTPCDAGLLIHLPAGECDIHPTMLGSKLLAQSIQDAN